MWYVVQVRTGDERKLAARLQLEVKAEGEDIFVPLFERRKSIRGEWTKVTTPLFPGYIFFQTDNVKDFYLRLKKINAFTRILGTESGFSSISPDEEKFLRILIGEDYIAQESVGVIEGDKITINYGPLRGMEGNILKINRHKRIAIIRADFMGGPREIKVGLEIIEKLPAKN
jgi:transcriptional antiterminator NusG